MRTFFYTNKGVNYFCRELSLTAFHFRVFLVNNINPTLATNQFAVLIADFLGF